MCFGASRTFADVNHLANKAATQNYFLKGNTINSLFDVA